VSRSLPGGETGDPVLFGIARFRPFSLLLKVVGEHIRRIPPRIQKVFSGLSDCSDRPNPVITVEPPPLKSSP